jgi:hypothetical protein
MYLVAGKSITLRVLSTKLAKANQAMRNEKAFYSSTKKLIVKCLHI